MDGLASLINTTSLMAWSLRLQKTKSPWMARKNALNGWNASSIGATVRTQSKSLSIWMKSIDRLLKVTAKMALTV